MDHQYKKREENEKRQRLFAQLDAVEERVLAGGTVGGSTQDATQALLQASALLDSDFVIADIKSANRELDFCEAALNSCSTGVSGKTTFKDVLKAFGKDFRDYNSEAGNDLKKYCLIYAGFFCSCPPFQTMKIALESLQPRTEQSQLEATQASQQKALKRKSMAAADKEATALERQANAALDKATEAEQAAVDARDQETSLEIRRVRENLISQLHANAYEPIDYWRFVFDPTCKGKTFMNILHVNHILLQKDIALIKGDRKGTFFLVKKENLPPTTQSSLDSIGFLLTDELYEELKRAYGDGA